MSNDIVEKFKHYYADLIVADLSRLDEIYDNEIIFKDPVHQVTGLVTLQDYFVELCGNLKVCRFEYLDILRSENTAYIKWNMHYRHPKLQSGKALTLKGVSHLQFDDRITFHEDVYDMGAMVYEHIPFVGAATRMIKRRLAKH